MRFSNVYGISPINYLMRARIEKAKTLLSTTDFSLSVISRSCDFPLPAIFPRPLKSCQECPPAHFAGQAGKDETTAK